MTHFNRNMTGYALIGLSLGSAFLLAACAGDSKHWMADTPNVEGRMLHASETFTGETTASIDGNGSIALVSDRGAHCGGPYQQVRNDNGGEVGAEETDNGLATLTCTDGRTGSVMFTVGADQAVGTGMLGQDIVTLTIAE
jgi:hypothetical protein